MTILHALIFGLVEGITEFLPVSSTAHLLLAGHLLGVASWDFFETFVVFIQIGAIGAVVVLSWKLFLKKEMLTRLCAAFIPTAIIGFVLHKVIHDVFFNSLAVIAGALMIGSLLIVSIDRKKSEAAPLPLREVSHKKFFLIGIFQSLAIIPGVSRSLASIFGGVTLGLSKKDAVLFSFLLAVPTIGAAGLYDILQSPVEIGPYVYLLAIGFLVSFVVAYGVMKWFLRFVVEKKLTGFLIYRIILGLLIVLFLL